MAIVPAVELMGIIAISIMVISYTLQDRNPGYIALFAFGCAMAAVYALLINAYPFAIAESIWSLVAFSRWKKTRFLGGVNQLGGSAG